MELYVALENVRSLQNVGAIIRSCGFFGISEIILVGYSGIIDMGAHKMLHPKITKASLGAEKNINFTMLESAEDLIFFAQKNSLDLIGIEQSEKSIKLYEFKPSNASILVFGHEREGVSAEVLGAANKNVEIERFGTKSSLNVATAVGITLYHVTSHV